MKAFIVFLLVIIVACASLWIYVEREIATTPQPTTPPTYPVPKKNVPDVAEMLEPATDEIPSDRGVDVSEPSENVSAAEEHTHEAHRYETPAAEPEDWTREDLPQHVSPQWQDANTTASSGDPSDFTERYRAQLKEQHGDIPEVDMFVELHKRMFREKKPVTMVEHLRFAELANFFYPSPQNEAGVEKLRQLLSEAGGDAIVITDPDKLPVNKNLR